MIKTYLNILFICCVNLLSIMSYGQITIATKATNPETTYDYIFNWDGNDIKLFGYEPYLVRLDENPRVEQSGTSYTNAINNDSFGYRISAVLDWDSDNAVTALGNGTFMEYLGGLTQAIVDKHIDLPDNNLLLGIGVENGASDDTFNRRDRVGIIGEALILTFDTAGRLNADNTLQNRAFVPVTSNFTNTGLNANTALRISDMHLEPSGIIKNNEYRMLDYLIYDASKNAILTEDISDSGIELGFQTKDTNGTIDKGWIIDDGDMIILAYRNPPLGMTSTLVQYSWGLWSLKMNLVDKSTLSSNSSITNPTTVLYPNPVSNQINIKLDKIYNNIAVKLLSIQGRELLSFNQSSKNIVSINSEHLKNGTYFLSINLDGNQSTIKFIKK